MVERSFLESIDDALAEKASLQSQLPEVISPACSRGGSTPRPSFARSRDLPAVLLPGHWQDWAIVCLQRPLQGAPRAHCGQLQSGLARGWAVKDVRKGPSRSVLGLSLCIASSPTCPHQPPALPEPTGRARSCLAFLGEGFPGAAVRLHPGQALGASPLKGGLAGEMVLSTPPALTPWCGL